MPTVITGPCWTRASNLKLRREIEGLLFDLFRGGADEAATFDQLSDLTGGKYPLLAYIYFLKDMDRFMPIQPTGFDRAFHALGIDFTTLRRCSWENYSAYNQTLAALRPLIEVSTGLKNVNLIDAHSFCWIFSTLLKLESEGSIEKAEGNKRGRIIVGGNARHRDAPFRREHGQKLERTNRSAHREEQGIADDPSKLET